MTSRSDITKLGHPAFLVSMALLIANDWLLKQHFNNWITGKLSDFAGLFAFAFLLSVLVPERKKLIHFSTACLFIFWKSSLSEPAIDFVNYFGLPIHRTPDMSDTVGLSSLFASYYTLGMNKCLIMNRQVLNMVLLVSSVSFFATTLPPRQLRQYSDIDKDYHFDIPKHELVSRLNAIQMKEIFILAKVSGGRVDFDAEKNVFHYHGNTDTLGLLLDYSKVTDLDTIQYKTSYAQIKIYGDESRSTLKLISLYNFIPAFKEKDYRKKAIRIFEKKVVKKIRRFPTPPTG